MNRGRQQFYCLLITLACAMICAVRIAFDLLVVMANTFWKAFFTDSVLIYDRKSNAMSNSKEAGRRLIASSDSRSLR